MSHADAAMFDRYVRYLDDDRFDEWLALFSAQGYYGLITHQDYHAGNRYMIIGENLSKLTSRIRSGARLDGHRKTRLLTAITHGGPESAGDEGVAPHARANFAYLKNGTLIFCGRYLAWFEGEGEERRIRKWMAVLDNVVIGESIFLPV